MKKAPYGTSSQLRAEYRKRLLSKNRVFAHKIEGISDALSEETIKKSLAGVVYQMRLLGYKIESGRTFDEVEGKWDAHYYRVVSAPNAAEVANRLTHRGNKVRQALEMMDKDNSLEKENTTEITKAPSEAVLIWEGQQYTLTQANKEKQGAISEEDFSEYLLQLNQQVVAFGTICQEIVSSLEAHYRNLDDLFLAAKKMLSKDEKA